jgi:hypothetical protein
MNPKEYKDIGEVYRNRFKDHESELNKESWSKIREKLPPNENYFTAFRNTLVNPRFITGVITGVLITSGIFFLTGPKTGKENNREVATNSPGASFNNNRNTEMNISYERDLSEGLRNSKKVDIPDSGNKIYSAKKETADGESKLTEINPANSEDHTSLSNQQVVKDINNHYEERNMVTKGNSRAMGDITDLKNTYHSSKINSLNSPINGLNTNSQTKNNDVSLIEANRSAMDSKNQNNTSNTLLNSTSSSMNPVSDHFIPSDPILTSGYKSSETVIENHENTAVRNNSVQVKSESSYIKTNESKININDSILNKSNISASEAQKINPPSLTNNPEVKTNSSEKNQLSQANTKTNDKAVNADSNSITKKEVKEKKSGQEHKPNSKLNSNPQSNWVLGYYFSPESSFRKLSANSDFKKQEGERNNNEKAKIGFSTGITLGYKISDRITLGSGMYVLNVGEKGGCYSQDSTSFIHYTNNYTYLGIPLLAGYKIGSNKFGTTINSGLIVTALVSGQNKGDKYYDDDYYTSKGHDDDDDDESAYSRFNLVYIANLEFNYQLYKKLSLHAGPSFKYFLASIYKEDHPIKSKPYSLGFQAGVKYHF